MSANEMFAQDWSVFTNEISAEHDYEALKQMVCYANNHYGYADERTLKLRRQRDMAKLQRDAARIRRENKVIYFTNFYKNMYKRPTRTARF